MKSLFSFVCFHFSHCAKNNLKQKEENRKNSININGTIASSEILEFTGSQNKNIIIHKPVTRRKILATEIYVVFQASLIFQLI